MTKAKDENLRCQIARAIAGCCVWANNRKHFGELEVIPNLVEFLRASVDSSVLKAVTKALNQLSKEPINCDELYKCEAVK
ncbi:MAG: Armadillo repeat-containing protein 4, partial [Paramarteilia canceri]